MKKIFLVCLFLLLASSVACAATSQVLTLINNDDLVVNADPDELQFSKNGYIAAQSFEVRLFYIPKSQATKEKMYRLATKLASAEDYKTDGIVETLKGYSLYGKFNLRGNEFYLYGITYYDENYFPVYRFTVIDTVDLDNNATLKEISQRLINFFERK